MRAHLNALKAALEPLGYPVHLFYAHPLTGQPEGTVPAVPYLVLRGAWDAPEDMPLCGTSDGLDTTVYVTAAASTAEGASIVLGRVRALLSPSLSRTSVPMAGRRMSVRWLRSEVEPQVDRDLRLPNSDRHPGFGVDSYHLNSVPTP